MTVSVFACHLWRHQAQPSADRAESKGPCIPRPRPRAPSALADLRRHQHHVKIPPLDHLPQSLTGVHSLLLQKRHQARSARVRRHTDFDNLAPLAEHSAYIFVPRRQQTPAQCGFFRSHLLVICAEKPGYTATAAREHRRVLAPRLPPAQVGASVTSPLHTPREVLFEMCQRRVLLARIKVRCARCSFANGRPPSKAALSHFAASRARSLRHADADE